MIPRMNCPKPRPRITESDAPPPPPPAQHASAYQYSSRFLNYVKTAENETRKGYSGGRWYPHRSVEGGTGTIAYGHKIKAGEDYSEGLSDSQAQALLHDDLDTAWSRANIYIQRNFGFDMKYLPQNVQEMLVDFEFNLGTLTGFPKFVRAVVGSDWDTAGREYKRFGAGHALQRRNDLFFRTFLAPLEK